MVIVVDGTMSTTSNVWAHHTRANFIYPLVLSNLCEGAYGVSSRFLAPNISLYTGSLTSP